MGCRNVPRLLVLPKDAAPASRIITLAHPRTSKPSRFFLDPGKGIYEFTSIAAPKARGRSWLITSQRSQDELRANESIAAVGTPGQPLDDSIKESKTSADDYIVENAEMLVATAIDPIFLFLACLSSPSAKSVFLSADDLYERLSEVSMHFNHVVDQFSLKLGIEARLNAICDTVDAGESMYRMNEAKLLAELVAKAEHMVASGLPESLEEKFVRRALDAPILSTLREEPSSSEIGLSQSTSGPRVSENVDSQDSSTTTISASTSISADTEITIPEVPALDSNAAKMEHLLRLRIALNYMIQSYVPAALENVLNTAIASDQSPINFKPLDERLVELTKLRAEAMAARSAGDFSLKRNAFADDEAAEIRADKKLKREEEEKKKKASESRGIRDLKKVDTKGMKKMGDFFGRRVSPRKKK